MAYLAMDPRLDPLRGTARGGFGRELHPQAILLLENAIHPLGQCVLRAVPVPVHDARQFIQAQRPRGDKWFYRAHQADVTFRGNGAGRQKS